eukprot:scaffold7473_cov141-Skeletonema_marinoi.AAC.15
MTKPFALLSLLYRPTAEIPETTIKCISLYCRPLLLWLVADGTHCCILERGLSSYFFLFQLASMKCMHERLQS